MVHSTENKKFQPNMNTRKKEFKIFDPNPSLKLALKIFLDIGITRFALIGKLAMWTHLEDESHHGYTKDDMDLKILLVLKNLNYQKTRKIVEKHLGPITAERLYVFARDAGILPKRGPYIYGRYD